eukprot:4382466-Amphidinium_carterae.1
MGQPRTCLERKPIRVERALTRKPSILPLSELRRGTTRKKAALPCHIGWVSVCIEPTGRGTQLDFTN